MAKIRTLSEAYSYIKNMDPETAITQNALRRMVVSGSVPCVKAGKKYLIDMDVLSEYLKGTISRGSSPTYISTIKKLYI